MNRNDNVITTTMGSITYYDFRKSSPKGTVIPGNFLKVNPKQNTVQLSQDVSDNVREECLNRIRVRVNTETQEIFIVFNVKAGLEFSIRKRKNQRSIMIYNHNLTEFFTVMFDIWDEPQEVELSDCFFESGFLVYKINGVKQSKKSEEE